MKENPRKLLLRPGLWLAPVRPWTPSFRRPLYRLPCVVRGHGVEATGDTGE